jgi:hypothetical protein
MGEGAAGQGARRAFVVFGGTAARGEVDGPLLTDPEAARY